METHALVASLIERNVAVKTFTEYCFENEGTRRAIAKLRGRTIGRRGWNDNWMKRAIASPRNDTWKIASARLLESEEYFHFWFSSAPSILSHGGCDTAWERKQAEFHPVAYFVRRSMKIASGYRCAHPRSLAATLLCRGQVTESSLSSFADDTNRKELVCQNVGRWNLASSLFDNKWLRIDNR